MTRHLPARRVARLVAAVILAAATGVSAPAAPASAATCATSAGVSVVVDFGTLGGGVQTSCDAGGASKNAAAMLGAAGYSLDYVQRFPGFICRVNGVPAVDPCVNTPPGDAYWGLYWSDGKNGQWAYSSIAAGGLRVPAGGYVGLAWQSSTDRRVPGVPASVRPSPKPTPTPTPSKSPPKQKPTPTPTPTPTLAPTTSATPAPTPSATPSKSPPKKKPSPSVTPSSSAPSSATPTPAESPSPVTAPTDSDAGDDSAAESAVPTWLVLAVLAALLVGGGAAIVVRRRGSPR